MHKQNCNWELWIFCAKIDGGPLVKSYKKSVKIDIIFENLFINKKYMFSVKPIKKLQRTNCLQWKKNICASWYFAPFCTITKYCWDVLALCHFLIVWSKKGLKIDTKPFLHFSYLEPHPNLFVFLKLTGAI